MLLSISCHCTKIMWLPGIPTDYWFSWGFNFRNIFFPVYLCICIQKCTLHILVPAAYPSHNQADLFKIPSPQFPTCTSLLWFSLWRTAMVPVVPVGSITLPFFGLTVMLCRLQIWSSQHSSLCSSYPTAWFQCSPWLLCGYLSSSKPFHGQFVVQQQNRRTAKRFIGKLLFNFDGTNGV